MPQMLRCATRNSPLAVWQAEHVQDALKRHHPEHQVQLLPLTTEGDRRLAVSLAKIGGKGLFVKEIEQAVLDGKADFAVHSLKDMPAQLDPRFVVPAFLKRSSPWDAVVSSRHHALSDLPAAPRVGTSSMRRAHQARLLWPHMECVPLRGNLDTRLGKLDSLQLDAAILAEAGLIRLGRTAFRIHTFSEYEMLPAAGQGILAVACLADNTALREVLASINDAPTQQIAWAERALNQHLGGSCLTPLAGYARFEQANVLKLKGALFGNQGEVMWSEASASVHGEASCHDLGCQVAEALNRQGAQAVLSQCRKDEPSV